MPERGSRDQRAGMGQPAGVIEMPTIQVPCFLCTWTVVRPGPGLESVSQLRYASALCGFRSIHQRPAAAGRASA